MRAGQCIRVNEMMMMMMVMVMECIDIASAG